MLPVFVRSRFWTKNRFTLSLKTHLGALMISPTLYHDIASFPCQIVRLGLAEKGVRWKGRRVPIAQGVHLKPKYLNINNSSDLPLFEHNEILLNDILTICLYINNNFPGAQLVPTTAEAREEMENWIRLSQQFPADEFSISPIVSKRSRRARGQVIRLQKMARHLKHRHTEHEEHYDHVVSDLQKQLSRATDKSFIERSQNRLAEVLDLLDQSLKDKAWLVGENYSLADVIWTVLLSRLDYCGQKSLWTGGKRSHVEAYYERLKKRSSFNKAHIIRNPSLLAPLVSFARLHWGVLITALLGAGVGGFLMMQM